MAKSKMLQLKSDSRHHAASLHKLSSRHTKVHHEKLQVMASEKKDWEDAVCSVCLEVPHNPVLLLCSSYEKGCRPYMCATSHHFSNCLEQYRKTYTKATSKLAPQSLEGPMNDMDASEESGRPDCKNEIPELLCPLCRGQVKGWTVVEPARKYLNAKKRTCTQDNCSFVGNYKEIKKHVKLVHPLACPRKVDPLHAEKWKKLENERDLNDVFSTIRSTIPGAIVLGDYVIETNYRGASGDYDDGDDDVDIDDEDGRLFNAFFGFPGFGGRWNGPRFARQTLEGDYDSVDEEYIRGLRSRAALQSRSTGRNIPRIARPHTRFLFARQARRSRERR
ncbi:hypothetical protein ACS0TY_036053 [Phlomoides rotata]